VVETSGCTVATAMEGQGAYNRPSHRQSAGRSMNRFCLLGARRVRRIVAYCGATFERESHIFHANLGTTNGCR
jgi:hypothetical protein